jgi:hypothetical protein
MRVHLNGGQEATEDEISKLESCIGMPLDGEFRKFVTQYDGAEPESNSFPVGGRDHVGNVEKFISVKNIPLEREYIDDISAQSYPVAISSGGNYVLLDQHRGGAVYFWDHEVPGGTTKIAEGFTAFLDMIQPFDESSVQPAPGQVKSAWIDPDFLKQFGG